jgi:glycosyltransferase involved in cell wall biosynthesis
MSRPLHICFLAVDFPIAGNTVGGIGNMVRILGDYLVAQGVRVTVLCYDVPNPENLPEYMGDIHIVNFQNRSGSFGLKNYRTINALLKNIHLENPIDIVETSESQLAFIKKIKGIKYGIRMHGGHHFFTDAEQRKREWRKVLLERMSYKKADFIIAVSHYVHQKTRDLMKWNYPVKVIYNPVDTKMFSKTNANQLVKGRVIFVGSILEKKGIRQLVMAMPLIKLKFPHAHLVVVGRDALIPGTNKPYRPILDQYLPPNYESYIHFTGVLPHEAVADKIATAEVCVYPSHMEAMPMAWLEALGMGKAFVGSLAGPGPEIIRHGDNGLLANPFSPEDIAEKVIWMLQHPEQAKKMGDAAFEDVQKRFAIAKVGAENFAYYQDLISSNKS